VYDPEYCYPDIASHFRVEESLNDYLTRYLKEGDIVYLKYVIGPKREALKQFPLPANVRVYVELDNQSGKALTI
jgi:hypothetical protein